MRLRPGRRPCDRRHQRRLPLTRHPHAPARPPGGSRSIPATGTAGGAPRDEWRRVESGSSPVETAPFSSRFRRSAARRFERPEVAGSTPAGTAHVRCRRIGTKGSFVASERRESLPRRRDASGPLPTRRSTDDACSIGRFRRPAIDPEHPAVVSWIRGPTAKRVAAVFDRSRAAVLEGGSPDEDAWPTAVRLRLTGPGEPAIPTAGGFESHPLRSVARGPRLRWCGRGGRRRTGSPSPAVRSRTSRTGRSGRSAPGSPASDRGSAGRRTEAAGTG